MPHSNQSNSSYSANTKRRTLHNKENIQKIVEQARSATFSASSSSEEDLSGSDDLNSEQLEEFFRKDDVNMDDLVSRSPERHMSHESATYFARKILAEQARGGARSAEKTN